MLEVWIQTHAPEGSGKAMLEAPRTRGSAQEFQESGGCGFFKVQRARRVHFMPSGTVADVACRQLN